MTVTGLNQLRVADITYIRLEWEFVYLAVVLDAFSRRVDRLGAGPHAGRRTYPWRIADGTGAAIIEGGAGTSFRPRHLL
jgi:hypothetical protein